MIEDRLNKLEEQIGNLPEENRGELLEQLAALRAEIGAQTGLIGSLEEFEAAHPDLAAALNRLSAALSHMGI